MKNFKIAEIVPLKFLELTRKNQYHMCLAHLVLQSDKYRDFYRRMSDEGKYVLVDNGAAEGEIMSYKDLVKVYELINPSEIILPDVLFNEEETIRRTREFLDNYDLTKYKKMIVPQGSDRDSWLHCYHMMSCIQGINTVGIPKWLGRKNLSTRIGICQDLKNIPYEIHLLGCNENPAIIRRCRTVNDKVRGCDSAFAYLCSKNGYREITPYTARPRNTSIEFLTDTEGYDLDNLMWDFELETGAGNNGVDETWR